jgi:threonine aldolase
MLIKGNFGSDNSAGIHPTILSALSQASEGSAAAYGQDDLTAAVSAQFSTLFERDCTVFFVATGTAANTLALASLVPPHGAIYCHELAHAITDECTAPELLTGGARLLGVPGVNAKPDLERLNERITASSQRGVHSLLPAALTLSNATELGGVLTPDELSAYAALARQYHMRVHVDGARFANAVVATGASPADLTWRSGVDVLSFGATKNGAMAAEAVVFFDESLAAQFPWYRKRSGHLWSKQRFLAAQFAGYLKDDLWLDLASHANGMAARMAQGLSTIDGVVMDIPVEANEIFPRLPVAAIQVLRDAGFVFYDWPPELGRVRLVTSFVTEPAEVDAFLAAVHEAILS